MVHELIPRGGWHADSYPDEEVFLHDLADGKLQVQLPFLTSSSSWVPLVLPPVTWVDRPPRDAELELRLAKPTAVNSSSEGRRIPRRRVKVEPKERLSVAAKEGLVETVRALVEPGTDLHRANNEGRTPLATARANNHEAAALALVQAGATE
jgi:hypothetical protein